MEQHIARDLQLGTVSRNAEFSALYVTLSAFYIVRSIFAMYKIQRTMPCFCKDGTPHWEGLAAQFMFQLDPLILLIQSKVHVHL